MIEKSDIIKAWAILRKTDSTIPDETLNFMRFAALKYFDEEINRDPDIFRFNEIFDRPGEYYSKMLGSYKTILVTKDLEVKMKIYITDDKDQWCFSVFEFDRKMLFMQFRELKNVSELLSL